MVYEGRGRSHSKRKKEANGAKRVFLALLWGLILVVAVAVAFPKTAASVRDKLAGALGVDLGGAMEVFSREVKEGGVFSATREAFKVAFAPVDKGEDMQALAGETQPTEPTAPTMPEEDPPEDTQGTQPVNFEDLPLPAHVTMEKPRENLVLAGPMAGEAERGFGYFAGENGNPVFHFGIDVKGESESSVRCVAPGTVAAVGESTIFGKYVIITHADGVESLYAMLGSTSLIEGQEVESAQTVGTLSGDTLHLELVMDGNYVNPQHYVYRNETT